MERQFADNNNKFDYSFIEWDGPEGYSLVIAENDSHIYKVALLLKNYFSEIYNIDLNIVPDTTKKKEKEIVIGHTNRGLIDENICVNEFGMKYDKGIIVFYANHYALLEAAVQRFIRLSKAFGKLAIFSQKTDFKATALDGYEYVWGDEFESAEIDRSKWDFDEKMTGTPSIMTSCDKDVARVEDGKLKLHAIEYKDENNSAIKYKVPYSVLTKYKMNFRYGYVEMRCKLPLFAGVWPSFWTQSTDALNDQRKADFMAEVDIFEVFGRKHVIPGIIKWPDNGGHSFWSSFKKCSEWSWENIENIADEYHIYGWEWNKNEMSMFVDGKKYMTFNINDSFDGNGDMQGFHDPMFIMFNNHLIAKDSGRQDMTIEGNEKYLPACYYIDWVRIYQKPDTCDIWLREKVFER